VTISGYYADAGDEIGDDPEAVDAAVAERVRRDAATFSTAFEALPARPGEPVTYATRTAAAPRYQQIFIQSPATVAVFHVAKCLGCDTWTPFGAAEERVAWANRHVESTGHTVERLTEIRITT